LRGRGRRARSRRNSSPEGPLLRPRAGEPRPSLLWWWRSARVDPNMLRAMRACRRESVGPVVDSSQVPPVIPFSHPQVSGCACAAPRAQSGQVWRAWAAPLTVLNFLIDPCHLRGLQGGATGKITQLSNGVPPRAGHLSGERCNPSTSKLDPWRLRRYKNTWIGDWADRQAPQWVAGGRSWITTMSRVYSGG
jgi:hypothetical protein